MNVSMPEELKERIRKAAAKDYRSMSSYIVSRMERILDEGDVKPKADVDLNGDASEFEKMFEHME
jgi:hypothetical protein